MTSERKEIIEMLKRLIKEIENEPKKYEYEIIELTIIDIDDTKEEPDRQSFLSKYIRDITFKIKEDSPEIGYEA